MKKIVSLTFFLFMPLMCHAKPWHERQGIIALMVAHQKDGGMGVNNHLPWKLREDLHHFKRETLNHPIIMGRRTHESIGRALPQRRNIVITRNHKYESTFPGVEIYHSLDEAFANINEEEEVFVIGGTKVFEEALPHADVMYRTLVDASVEADTFFPKIKEDDWELVDEKDVAADDENEFSYVIQKLIRRDLYED